MTVIQAYSRPVARVAVLWVLPALGLLALAVLDGLVRTAALGLFGVLTLLRGAFLVLERGGEFVPNPRVRARSGSASEVHRR